MRKVLVTGANGFVGTALCVQLSQRGMPYVAGTRTAGSSFHVPVGDINADTDWSRALADCGTIIHLAARVHVMNEKLRDPLAAFRAMNVDATLNLARQAALNGIQRFVFVSSVKVNGEKTTGTPFTAFDEPAPLDPYGQSKMEAETGLRELANSTGLEVVIVRPPLVYGPGVRANFLKLMQLIDSGIPLPLGSIDNRRSMVSLDNLVDLLIVCSAHPHAPGQTFMVSDDRDIGISDLLRMLARAMGKRAHLLSFPPGLIARIALLLGKSDLADRLLGSLQVDIAHTKSTLGWQPVTGMPESVNKTVQYYLTHR